MYTMVKRKFDVIIALILLILLFPFCLIIAILIMFCGIKNPIFKQVRTGKNNKQFVIYKFTTMDKYKNVPFFCQFLRRSGIDEILQLINVIKGDMSLVGPRPWITDYSKYFNDEQKKRLNVLPGMTGLAQISNTKNIFERIEKDVYYVNNISFKMDLYIIVNSIRWIFSGSKNEFTHNDIKQDLYLLKNQWNR